MLFIKVSERSLYYVLFTDTYMRDKNMKAHSEMIKNDFQAVVTSGEE